MTRLLLVGRNRYSLPLDPSLRRKFDALSARCDWRLLASAPPGGPTRAERIRLVPPLRPRRLDGLLFYVTFPFRVAGELRRFRPDVVSAQSLYEAAAVLLARALVRSDARVLVDIHGDWRTSTRLYGTAPRRLLAPLADRVALAALRRVDAVRTISDYTTGLVRGYGIEPAAVFPAFMDLEPFLGRPPVALPERPVALFVGVLEPYKNIDGLADAWRRVVRLLPEAALHIVGTGTRTDIVEALLVDLPDHVRWTPALTTEGVAAALDDATLLVLPSRSEGMGRVVVEAFCRARCVVGSHVGGIRDLLVDGRSGLFVDPGDAAGIAEALVRVLGDHALAERLGAGARESAEHWSATPEEFADRLVRFAEAGPARSAA